MQQFTIQTAAKLSGLSADVIRVWERRYRAVTPLRSARGSRLYSFDDILRLKLLANAVRRGERISSLAMLDTESLRRHPATAMTAEQTDHSRAAQANVVDVLDRQATAGHLGRSAASNDFLNTLYHGAVRGLVQGMDLDSAAVLAYDEATGMLSTRATHGWPTSAEPLSVPNDQTTLFGFAFSQRESTIMTDSVRETRFKPVPQFISNDVRSAIAIPFGTDHHGGVISGHTSHLRRFNPEDITFISSVAEILGIASDRARTYKELQRVNDVMSEIVSGFVEGFATTDMEGRLTYADRAAMRYLGEDYAGRAAHEVIPHLREPRYRARLEEALATGKTIRYDFYSELLKGWYEACLQPISGGLSISFRDISMQKITHFALESSGAFARMVMRSVPGAFWTTDPQLVVLSASGKLLRMLGLRRSQIIGRHVGDAFASLGNQEPIIEGHTQALNGEPAQITLEVPQTNVRVFVEQLRDVSSAPVGTIAFAISAT